MVIKIFDDKLALAKAAAERAAAALTKALEERKTLRQVVAELEGVAPDPGPVILLSATSKKRGTYRRARSSNNDANKTDALQQTRVHLRP